MYMYYKYIAIIKIENQQKNADRLSSTVHVVKI